MLASHAVKTHAMSVSLSVLPYPCIYECGVGSPTERGIYAKGECSQGAATLVSITIRFCFKSFSVFLLDSLQPSMCS